MRRVAVLAAGVADDPYYQLPVMSFVQGLQEAGWALDGNLRIDIRYGGGDDDRLRVLAAELVALAPDVILAAAGPAMRALHRPARNVPIVFVSVIDPVGAGYVASLSRPGGNVTGFAGMEFGVSAKWLELLKQVAPRVTRVAVVRDPATNPGGAQLGAIQAVASSFAVEVTPLDVREPNAIERGLTAFARGPGDGLIVTASVLATIQRKLIISLADRHRLPSVYSARNFVADGGLISYGSVTGDMYRRAAGYVDRILKGEKPTDLPVQTPVKYETVLNLKTAKALGLDVPATVLVRADEVIE